MLSWNFHKKLSSSLAFHGFNLNLTTQICFIVLPYFVTCHNLLSCRICAAHNVDKLMSRQRTFPLNEQAKVLLCCSIPNAALRLFECWTVIGCVSFAFALLVGYKVVSNMTPEEGCRQAWQDMPSLMPSCSGSGIRLVPSCMCAGHKSGDKVQRDIETGSEGDEEIVKTDFTPPNVPPLPIAAAREIEVEEERSESDPQASSQQSIPLPARVNS